MLTFCMSTVANAQSVESLVMPGELVSSHAEYEAECSSCHKRFDRKAQKTLCLDCHEEIAADLDERGGYHGKFPDIADAQCASCHTDHEGRNVDIIGLTPATFDHQFTDYLLEGGHADAECESCHLPGVKHRDAPTNCVGCHQDDEPHEGFLGESCGDCHNSSDWLDIKFDHDTTAFPLLGMHREADCSGCHEDQTHQDMQTNCYDCHAADDVHEGRSGQQCADCHNPASWTETSFDHSRDTDFPLLGKHGLASCDSCHSKEPFADDLDSDCVSCHLEDDSHDGHNGSDCGLCHVSEDWLKLTFDHSRDSEFELRHAHREVACADCHIEPMFEQSPGDDCASCHKGDEPHAGKLGQQCENCHAETVWQEAPFFDHSLTTFPLLGDHQNQECEACHATAEFVDTEQACSNCHDDDDPHNGRFGDTCSSCHNPVAWDLWLFDHDTQTQFVLNGAHREVQCNDCHRSTLGVMHRTGTQCGDCHRADDTHDNEFGADCGRCHSDGSFKDVRSLQ